MAKRKRIKLGDLLFDIATLLPIAALITLLLAHPLLVDRDKGTCRTLRGDMTLKAVFVSLEDAPWSPEAQAVAQQKLLTAARGLEQDAAVYGTPLSICVECHQVSAPRPYDPTDEWRWVRQLLRSSDTLDSAGYAAYSDTPVLFLLDLPGRAHSHNPLLPGFEYCFVYHGFSEATVRHELLHLFGAEDYYFHPDVEATAQELYPDSIMLSSKPDYLTDSLTAYLVGWTEEPDEAASRMLAETRRVSMLSFSNARKTDQKDGQATVVRDGDTYTGNLLSGLPHGQGRMEWADGVVYEGDWGSGHYHGQGTLRWPDGMSYAGDFAYGQPHGAGTYTWPDGSVYTGEVAEGCRTGQGALTWPNGDSYTGEFENGLMSGQGTLRWANGDVYTGQFLNNMLHGEGVLTCADGSRLTGTWENHKYVENPTD